MKEQLINQLAQLRPGETKQLYYEDDKLFVQHQDKFYTPYEYFVLIIMQDKEMSDDDKQQCFNTISQLKLKKGIIYGYFTKNGHCLYIGQTTQKPEKRRQQHIQSGAKFNLLPFYGAFSQLAVSSLDYKELIQVVFVSQEVFNLAEKEYQQKYRSIYNNPPYNQCDICLRIIDNRNSLVQHLFYCN